MKSDVKKSMGKKMRKKKDWRDRNMKKKERREKGEERE